MYIRIYLKFHQNYKGHGKEFESYTIYPKEADGLIFKDIKEGRGSIFLGEVEGKHSERYGDLTISEIDTEDLLPEFGCLFPFLFTSLYVKALHDGHDESKANGEWYKNPVIAGCKCKLRSCPICCCDT